MTELPSVITIESDTVPAIEACEAHLHRLARLNTAELVVTAVSRESDRGLANKPDLTSTVTTEEPTP
jgi:hypothetical protein